MSEIVASRALGSRPVGHWSRANVAHARNRRSPVSFRTACREPSAMTVYYLDTLSAEDLLREGACLRSLARRLIGNDQEAEDLAQEGLARSLGRAFRSIDHCRGWLRLTVRNAAIESRRARGRASAREQGAARQEAVSSPEETALQLEAIELVAGALRSMPEPYKSTLTQLYVQERTPKEIARSRGIPLNTVHKQRQRGLQLMREELDARGESRGHWLLPCIALARAPRATGVASALTATTLGVLVLTACGLVALVFKVLLGEAPGPASTAVNQMIGVESAASEDLYVDRQGELRPQRSAAAHAVPTVRVVHAGTKEAVDGATVAYAALSGDGDAEIFVRRWLQLGRLEEEKAAEPHHFRTDASGTIQLDLVHDLGLVVAAHSGLFGYTIAARQETGVLEVQVYENRDLEVILQDGDGRAHEGIPVYLLALGYYGERLIEGRSDEQGRVKLPHGEYLSRSYGSSEPTQVDIIVDFPGLGWLRHPVDRLDSPINIRIDERLAYVDVRVVEAESGRPCEEEVHFDLCLSEAHDIVSFVALAGVARVAVPVGALIEANVVREKQQILASPVKCKVTAPNEIVTLELVVPPPPVVAVNKMTVAGRLVGEDGRALTERRVVAWTFPGSVGATTDADGRFAMQVSYRAPSDSSGLWLADDQDSRLIRLIELHPTSHDSTLELGDIAIGQEHSFVSGVVRTAQGVGVSGARVSWRGQFGDEYRCIEVHTDQDGAFDILTEKHDRPDGHLVVSHPGFGAVCRSTSVWGSSEVIVLPPERSFRGRVLLDPSVPHADVWVEANLIDEDVEWLSRNEPKGTLPPPSFVRVPLDVAGGFELRGIGEGDWFVSVRYYGREAFSMPWHVPAILYSGRLKIVGVEPQASVFDVLDLSRRYRRQRVSVVDTSGNPVGGATISVHGASKFGVFSYWAGECGSTDMIVECGARLTVEAEEYLRHSVDAWSAGRLQLESKPMLRFALSGPPPMLESGYSLLLWVRWSDESIVDQLPLLPETRTVTCPIRDDVSPQLNYLVRDESGSWDEVCGEISLAELQREQPILIDPPSPLALQAALDVLRAKRATIESGSND
jgi:RNA polymerase sigma factor (sigma-70 family)